jgi:hypothetical protein
MPKSSFQRCPRFGSLLVLQWEIVTNCWRINIDFWQLRRAWLYWSIFFLSHWLYSRWRNGKKSMRSMADLARLLEDSLISWAIDKWSNLWIQGLAISRLGMKRNR